MRCMSSLMQDTLVYVLHRRLIRRVSIQSWNNRRRDPKGRDVYYFSEVLSTVYCAWTIPPFIDIIKDGLKMSISIMFLNVLHYTLTTFNSNLKGIVCGEAITKYNEANYWKSTRNGFYFVTKRKHRFEDLKYLLMNPIKHKRISLWMFQFRRRIH